MADTKADFLADSSTVTPTQNATSQPNNPLSRKLNKILETRLDNDKVRREGLACCQLVSVSYTICQFHIQAVVDLYSCTTGCILCRVFQEKLSREYNILSHCGNRLLKTITLGQFAAYIFVHCDPLLHFLQHLCINII